MLTAVSETTRVVRLATIKLGKITKKRKTCGDNYGKRSPSTHCHLITFQYITMCNNGVNRITNNTSNNYYTNRPSNIVGAY